MYYLKNTTAEVVAQSLNTLLGNSGASTTETGIASANDDSALDGIEQARIIGLITSGNTVEKTGSVTITADVRLNALMIQANPVDHKTIEKLLPILDQ